MMASRSKGKVWRFAEFEFHELSRELFANGQLVHLEGKPKEVLAHLLETPKQLVSVNYLLDSVWPDVNTGPDSVMVAIAKLRRTFGGPTNRIIRNLSGEGYGMATPVSVVFRDEADSTLILRPGDLMPRRSDWTAIGELSRNEASPVWLARHTKTGELRVFKFALDGVRLRGLQREFAVYRLLTASLGPEASFLVRIVDASFEELPAFLESVPAGENLLTWSERETFRSLPLKARVAVAAEVATSMALAHQLAVFHNDLKPSNLLMSESSDGPDAFGKITIHVADFGAASLSEPELLHRLDISDPGSLAVVDGSQARLLGTEMYRAPEWRSGELPTAQNDVYAMGVLLYQLASGNFREPPLPGWKEKVDDPLLREDIEEAAHVDPKKRVKTMADLANRLRNFEARRVERKKEESARADMREMEASLARMRMRRPWVRIAIASLAFGLAASIWTTYRVVHERDIVRRANDTLEQMYQFLAKDVLGQSNPYLPMARKQDAAHQTLVEAVDTAVPQIDARFSHQPMIAGRLHETVADTYKDRTRFLQADQEYVAAASDYRAVEGDLSQAALIVDLKREFAAVTSMRPGAMSEASTEFKKQEARIATLKHPTATLQAWETLMKTSLLGMGPHPEQAIPFIDAAVRRAEGTPGFDSTLLLRLKKQYCGTYVRLGDGGNLERVSKEIIADITREYGEGNPLVFPYQMYLEEAFYLQGRYADTVAQADRNEARFTPILGEQNQLTIATLATRAAAEAQMEKYGEAVKDALALHSAAHMIGDRRLEVGSLNDAATYECRQGDLDKGMEHARQVMRESEPGPIAQPMFYNGSMFTLAECLLASQERSGRHTNPHVLKEADDLLAKVDVRQMAETADESAYEGARNVALARLELLRGADREAKRYTALADPLVNVPHADPFESRELRRVQAAVAATRP